MTKWERILLVALSVERDNEPQYSMSRLTEAAWLMFPHEFGMEGYEQKYPDKALVSCHLYGDRGPIKKGFLRVNEMTGEMSLTQKGKMLVLKMEAALARNKEKFPDELIARLFATDAYLIYAQGMRDTLELHHALDFWKFPKSFVKGLRYDELIGSCSRHAKELASMVRRQQVGIAGRFITIADADRLSECALFLKTRFRRTALQLRHYDGVNHG